MHDLGTAEDPERRWEALTGDGDRRKLLVLVLVAALAGLAVPLLLSTQATRHDTRKVEAGRRGSPPTSLPDEPAGDGWEVGGEADPDPPEEAYETGETGRAEGAEAAAGSTSTTRARPAARGAAARAAPTAAAEPRLTPPTTRGPPEPATRAAPLAAAPTSTTRATTTTAAVTTTTAAVTTTTTVRSTTTTAGAATTTTAPARGSTTTTTRRGNRKSPSRPTTTVRLANRDTGVASWYNAPDGTCAHRTIARETTVKVTNLANGKSTTCRVADWGPADTSRIIDLSMDTFAKLADTAGGLIQVRIEW